jgi:hypothetical protein
MYFLKTKKGSLASLKSYLDSVSALMLREFFIIILMRILQFL